MMKRLRRFLNIGCSGRYWFHHYHAEDVSQFDMPHDPDCHQEPKSYGTVQCMVCCRCGQLAGYANGVTV